MLSAITKRLGKAAINTDDVKQQDDPELLVERDADASGPSPMDPAAQGKLANAGVDMISCRSCPAQCDPGNPDAEPEEIHSDKLLTAWSKQSIDLQGKMLGANSPFLRHVLISTGKKDWPHDITTVDGSLAQWFDQFATEKAAEASSSGGGGGSNDSGDATQLSDENESNNEDAETETEPELPEGCWQTTVVRRSRRSANPQPKRPTRSLVGNSSHVSTSRHHHGQTVLLFPDYVAVTDVRDGTSGPEAGQQDDKSITRGVFRNVISGPPLGSSRNKALKSSQVVRSSGISRRALPYTAVVVLCSHYKRDARCGIAAPMLAEVFRRHAEAAGWEVDEKGEMIGGGEDGEDQGKSDSDAIDGSQVQFDGQGLPQNKGWGYIHEPKEGSEDPSADEQLLAWRRLAAAATDPSSTRSQNSSHASPPTPSLCILYTSHIGKHAWSGNVIVYFPNGAGVWYARVDPVNGGAGRVWEQTILQGKVIPEYLRAGINLYRGTRRQSDATTSTAEEEQSLPEHLQTERVSGLKSALLPTHQAPGILRW